MNSVKTIHDADMDCVVEPGITWNELNDILKKYKLFFPVDPGPGASIGGMCGTSCSGTNAVRYGTMRNNVLNLTVVLADGTILKTAQRARKSSAGYNLTNLFIGSEGTLGIITEATLRLQNMPQHTAVAVCSFPTIHAAADAAIDVQRAGIRIGAVELLDDVCIKVVNQYVGLKLAESPTIFFKFHGSKVSVAEEISQVGEIVKNDTKAASSSGRWRRQSVISCGKDVKARCGERSLITRTIRFGRRTFVFPISALADCISATKDDIAQSQVFAPIVGHVGDGNFHVMLSIDPKNQAQMAAAQKINARMVERAIANGRNVHG